ncbi:MAG: hypothetical protein HY222_07615 [Thaumarchaeota archaeon]|nr:hypothetical protein [Nitrososphaerota archaeon]MBI3642242.1 hypothetical protein [Nitrososphaerota archaeon]
MRKGFLVAICGGVLTVVIVVILLIEQGPTEKYAIFLDPFKDKQPLVIEIHVTVQNVGKESLTNVKVNYGGSSKPDIIPLLKPGEKVILSPSAGSDLQEVTVTTDQGISITKPYRIPINMPGMMGS